MKNIFNYLMLVAVAAMGFACQKSFEQVEAPATVDEVVMTINADVDATRTYIDEANSKVQWSEGDQLKVIENSATYRTTTDIAIDGEGKAKFTVAFPANTTDAEFTYNAIFPATAVAEDDADAINAAKVKVIVKDQQLATATSFDPQADVLVANQVVSEVQPTELNMQFKRIVSLGKMTLKNLPADAKISQVVFTAGADDVLAGRNYVNATTGKVLQYGYHGKSNAITVSYSEAIDTRVVYFVCNPFTMEAGETFKVKVVCEDKTYTREVVIPEGRSLTFTEGNLGTFSVDMANATSDDVVEDTITIADALAVGNGNTIGGTIEGVVVSNMDLNNLTSKKGMYVQDETGALQFYLAANHSFAFGTKVRIDLTDAKLGSYNGAVQVSGVALAKITAVSTGNTVTPKTVTMADFLVNKYEGQYIALEGVQVAASDLSNTWVMGGAHTSITMEDANGNSFVVFSSKYASYGAETVAQGAGTLKGISSINNGNMQIIFAQESDYAGLTGERFGDESGEEPEQPGGEEPEQPTGEAWVLVKNVSDLAVDDEVIIVAANENYALSTTQNTNNRGSAVITKNGETVTIDDKVQILTLKAGNIEGTFAFYTGSGYLYTASTSKNHLKTETKLSNNSSWNITISSTGVATIKAQGTSTRNWLRFNKSNSPKIFACYSSGQTDVVIYKKTNN